MVGQFEITYYSKVADQILITISDISTITRILVIVFNSKDLVYLGVEEI